MQKLMEDIMRLETRITIGHQEVSTLRIMLREHRGVINCIAARGKLEDAEAKVKELSKTKGELYSQIATATPGPVKTLDKRAHYWFFGFIERRRFP